MAWPQNKPRPAVFLDRDGVLNEDLGYVHRADQLKIIAGVPAALEDLKNKGYLLLVVSNQSGVARGLFDLGAVEEFNRLLNEKLIAEKGGGLDGFFVCPHHPEGVVLAFKGPCACRKPEPGLILQACQKFNIDLATSFLVGDKPDDCECAVRAGVRPIQIHSRYGPVHPQALAAVATLAEAVTYIPAVAV